MAERDAFFGGIAKNVTRLGERFSLTFMPIYGKTVSKEREYPTYGGCGIK
jgi:hypothetical protein